MKIYMPHATGFDYKNELYKVVRESDLDQYHTIILPHEESDEPFNTLDVIRDCDLVIAEVSYPSTGLGIELGWVSFLKKPVIAIYKKGNTPSSSIQIVTKDIIEYEPQTLAAVINQALANLQG